MPKKDGTGYDGRGPKKINKGNPAKDGRGQCKNRARNQGRNRH